MSVGYLDRPSEVLTEAFERSTGDQLTELLSDGHWAGQLDHLTAAGEVITVLSRQVLHRPKHGPDQILEINTDVTAARAAECAWAESGQQFRAQFTYSATGQVVHALGASSARSIRRTR
jgi:hypothetical protein